MKQYRYDVGGMRSKPRVTSQGFLAFNANLTRTGVLNYKRADGSTVRELRHPDEVFRQETLDSLIDAPLTDGHPSEFVSPENIGVLGKGIVKTARQDNTFCAGEILVQAKDMIVQVTSGTKKELSPGYTCDIDPTPGVFNGERYDQIQRNIIYNHIAALPPGHGRSGASVSFRNDSEGYEIEPTKENETMPAPVKKTQPATPKETVTIEKTVKVDMVERSELDEATARLDEAEAVAAAAKDELEKLKAERDELKARADGLDIGALVAERVKLETDARKVCGKDTKFVAKREDGVEAPMTDRKIRETVILAKYPKLEGLEKKADAYVSARFDAIVEGLQEEEVAKGQSEESMRKTLDAANGAALPPVKLPDVKSARETMVEEGRNAWKK